MQMWISILYKFLYISWQLTWTSLSATHHPAVGREMEKVIHLFVSFDLAPQFLEYKLTKNIIPFNYWIEIAFLWKN